MQLRSPRCNSQMGKWGCHRWQLVWEFCWWKEIHTCTSTASKLPFCICSWQNLSDQLPAHFALCKPGVNLFSNFYELGSLIFIFYTHTPHHSICRSILFSHIKGPLWFKIWQESELFGKHLYHQKLTSTNGWFVLNVRLCADEWYWYLFSCRMLQYQGAQPLPDFCKHFAQNWTQRCCPYLASLGIMIRYLSQNRMTFCNICHTWIDFTYHHIEIYLLIL